MKKEKKDSGVDVYLNYTFKHSIRLVSRGQITFFPLLI